VFGLFIAGACALVVKGREVTDTARSHYTAVNLGKNALERARVLPFDQLESFQTVGVCVDGNGNPDPDGNYRITATMTNIRPYLSRADIVVEIKNRITLAFDGECEEVESYIAHYQEPLQE